MKHFVYTARDKEGAQVQGKLQADDKPAAVRVLKDRNLFILSLEEKKTSSPFPLLNLYESLFCRVNSEMMMIFVRELATMIGLGFPLLTSLEILKEDIKSSYLEDVLTDIASRIKSGAPFSEALEDYPHLFSPLFINLIKAGEASGELDRTLESLANYMESIEKMKKKVQGAMLYPVILIVTTIVIISLFMVFAVPKFKEIFDSFGSELPYTTRAFLNFSTFLQHEWLFIILAIIALPVGLHALFKNQAARRWLDRVKIVFPVIKEIYLRLTISRFARTMAILYSSGVPLLESFSLVSKVTDNMVLQETIMKASSSVQEGETISAPLKASGLFPNMTIHMIDVGEKSGTLDKMLRKIADLYDLQIETWLNSLTAIIEPLLVIFIGLVIAFLVIVMALPIMRLPSIILH